MTPLVTLAAVLAALPVPLPDDTLTLATAAQRALAVHPALRGAAAAADGAAAAVGEARSRWLPQITTQATLTRFQEPMIVSPLHGFAGTPIDQIAFERTLIQGNVSLGYTLFDGGARGARIGGARAEAGARAAERDRTTQTLLADVTHRYLAVLTAREVLAAQEDGVRALTAERDRVDRLLAAGEAAPVEQLRVAAALAQARAERVVAAAELDAAARALARTAGLPAVDPAALAPITGVAADSASRAELLTRAAATSPVLAEAQRTVDGARMARRSAIAAWFPQLDVYGGVFAYGSGAGAFTTEWQAGARLSYPLFLGGARGGAVARAGALLTAAEARRDAARLDIADALDRALAARDAAAARGAALTVATVHLDDVARVERLALESGAGTEAEWLRAEAAARRARADLAAARAAAVTAEVQLAGLTGVLSLEWLTRNVEMER